MALVVDQSVVAVVLARGLGKRMQRFAMVVDNGKITHLNVEEPGAFEVSSAEYVMGQL